MLRDSVLHRLPDHCFDLLGPSCIELLFVRSQLAEESKELSGVNAFFIGDVLNIPPITRTMQAIARYSRRRRDHRREATSTNTVSETGAR